MFPKETVSNDIIPYIICSLQSTVDSLGSGPVYIAALKFIVDLFSWGIKKKKHQTQTTYATQRASNVLPWLYFQLGKRVSNITGKNTASLLKEKRHLSRHWLQYLEADVLAGLKWPSSRSIQLLRTKGFKWGILPLELLCLVHLLFLHRDHQQKLNRKESREYEVRKLSSLPQDRRLREMPNKVVSPGTKRWRNMPIILDLKKKKIGEHEVDV